MTYRDMIKQAKLADAQAWGRHPEKFLFCVDWLEISAHSPYSDRLVDELETRFLQLLDDAQ